MDEWVPPNAIVSSCGSTITAEACSTIFTLIVSRQKTRKVRGTYETAEHRMDMLFVEAGNGVVLGDVFEILGYLLQSLRVGPERFKKFGWRTADSG